MSALEKTVDGGDAEYVLYFNPCDPQLFARVTQLAGPDLKEIIFSSLAEFASVDLARLPRTTRLTLALSLRELTAARIAELRGLRDREVYLLVEIDFTACAADPATYLAPLRGLDGDPRLSFSLLVRRSQYEAFVSAVAAINHAFALPLDFTLEYFDAAAPSFAAIEFWKAQLDHLGEGPEFRQVTFPFYNRAHNFVRRRTLLIQGAELYLVPQLYQNLNWTFSPLRLPERLDRAALEAQVSALTLRQLNAAETMDQCADCKNLIFCAGRFTLTVLRDLGLTACPFPSAVVAKINAE